MVSASVKYVLRCSRRYQASPTAPAAAASPFASDAEALDFLRHADVVSIETIPDGLFIAASGLFCGLGEDSGRINAWRFERPERGLVIIRMTEPL